MRDGSFASWFYVTRAWRETREAVLAERGYLCERCHAQGRIEPATEVHHIRPLTRQNMHDPDIALNPDNLMALCTRCHDEIHAEMAGRQKRYTVGADGSVELR